MLISTAIGGGVIYGLQLFYPLDWFQTEKR